MALGQPCIAGLPGVSRLGGFNRLLNFNCSLLALRARRGQRGCGTLPYWNAPWLDLGNSTAGEERRDRGRGTNPHQTRA